MQGKSKKIQRIDSGPYRFGDFELWPAERQLYRQDKAVSLPPKAFDALLVLVRRAEQLVRKEELIEVLWPDTYVMEANLTNTVVILRKVLGRNAIQTVSKYGYRFKLPVLGEPGVGQAAYATFVRAKQLTSERSLDSMIRARDLYWLCLAEDPGFAQAWAWLGRCCRFIEKFSGGASVSFEMAQAALLRALSIDPHLACAHHFYTQLQGDCGESLEAMGRLLARLRNRGEEPESFAGLVQVLRFCGLLDESVAAHVRAKTLDPTVTTSVPHTYFLRGEYEATIEIYGRGGKGYYLDAASWAALGDARRAIALLRERVGEPQLSPLMSGLMGSLLSILEDRPQAAVDAMKKTEVVREPEVLFYFARHFALIGNAAEALDMLKRAFHEGFRASSSIERDPAWSALRKNAAFKRVLGEAKVYEENAKRAFEQAGGRRLLRL
jgi:tetratricopeptide (TPR) repeat protein